MILQLRPILSDLTLQLRQSIWILNLIWNLNWKTMWLNFKSEWCFNPGSCDSDHKFSYFIYFVWPLSMKWRYVLAPCLEFEFIYFITWNLSLKCFYFCLALIWFKATKFTCIFVHNSPWNSYKRLKSIKLLEIYWFVLPRLWYIMTVWNRFQIILDSN